jgi:serine/threonine protein kinase
MEKCDSTLSKYIWENQSIETTEKIDLVIQMSKAIAFLHADHLIHMDVKPSNFLLKIRRKGWPIVKVTDIGFTKRIVGSSNQLNSKLDYAAMAWIAPELYDPPFRFTTACDVWSFGCVIYYSFTGGKHPFDPFGGRSLADRVTNIIQKKINIMALKNQSKDVIDQDSNQRLQFLILSDEIQNFLFCILYILFKV